MPQGKFYQHGSVWNRPPDMNPDRAASVEETLSLLDSVFEEASSQLRTIDTSDLTSTKGKATKRQELAAAVVTKLGPIDKRLAGADAHAAQVRDTIETKLTERRRAKGGAELSYVVGKLEQQEVRALIRAMNPIEAASLYREAARRGPDVVVDAVELSPIRMSFLTDELMAEAYDLRAARLAPEESQLLADLRRMRTVIAGGVASLKQQLKERGLRFSGDDSIKVTRAAG